MTEIANSNRIPQAGHSSMFPLPPLILHPFSSAEEAAILIASSRASLALQGLAPMGPFSIDELDKQLLRGRYAELRMLFYIGKDINRWAEQCVETIKVSEVYNQRIIRVETFAVYLVQHVPQPVQAKLEGWGVLDFRNLFRRSYGLHSVFAELPPVELLSLDFLRRYHKYLDRCFEQRLNEYAFDRAAGGEFEFDLYASGEYSKMLEKSWAQEPVQRP